MYKNILIPTDGSDLSAKAVQHGVSLAKSLGAKIVGLHVSEPFHWFDPNMMANAEAAYQQGMKQAAAAALTAIAEAAEAAGVAYETVHAENQFPYKAIIATAQSRGCDLVVMASHGRRGVSAVVLGSETVKVLTHSGIPVLVCR